MSELKVTGTVYKVFETQVISDSFKKREFVIKTQGDYPQLVKFELTQDNCSKADNLKVGQAVKVGFNLRGREWINPQGEAKYFNTLQAWRISTLQQSENPAPMAATTEAPPADSFADDMPF